MNNLDELSIVLFQHEKTESYQKKSLVKKKLEKKELLRKGFVLSTVLRTALISNATKLSLRQLKA